MTNNFAFFYIYINIIELNFYHLLHDNYFISSNQNINKFLVQVEFKLQISHKETKAFTIFVFEKKKNYNLIVRG